MKFTVLIVLPLIWKIECWPLDQGSATDTIVEVTPYPDTHKKYIDINNVSPEVSNILSRNNLNLDQIKAMHAKLAYQTFPQSTDRATEPSVTTASTAQTAAKEVDEEIRLNSIKINLEKTLRGQDEDSLISNAEFDYALAAVCEMPRHFNISDWFGQKSWNIFFKPTYRQYNVKSVMLRLFKVALPNVKTSRECETDVGEFYKYTVSVYYRKRRETKKKVIYAQMIQRNFNGWVEIDALSTLKFWELPRNNLGLAIDIFDEDDNQLDAKDHFHLQNCEAGPQIPWKAFHLLAETYGTSVSEDAVEVYRNMYTGPRLDITSSSPANYSASSEEQQQPAQQQKTRHSRHIHGSHHHHPQRSSDELTENYENYSHQPKTRRRDHSHRSHTNAAET